MRWKDLPYWAKGGVLIGGVHFIIIGLPFILSLFGFKGGLAFYYPFIDFPQFIIYKLIGIKSYFLQFILFGIFGTLMYFILGALIGLIIGKTKFKKVV